MTQHIFRATIAVQILFCLVASGQQTKTVAQADAGQFRHVKQFGALGDGVTDDTDAIQVAVNAIGESGGGTLLFPPGTYVVRSVGLRAGIRYLGYGAIIRRPAKQGKWVRTFDAAKKGYVHSAEEDSRPLVIEGLTFDGNLANQGPHEKYELEQAHLVFLCADPNRAGRLQAKILNCHFQDCVADGISVYTNVDVQVTNCTARDCFRGGITVTGGYTRAQITDFTAQGKRHPTGIDIEIDGLGFGKSLQVEISINGLMLPSGDFDVAVSDGSTVVGSNIIAQAPFYLHARDSVVRFSNSTFGVGQYSAYNNRIVHPGDTTFHNCTFTVDGKSGDQKAKWAAIHVYWNISGGTLEKQSLRVIDCDFRVSPGIADADTTYAIYCEGDHAEKNNRLLVDGGRIPADFDYGVYIFQGGTVALRATDIRAATPMYFGLAENWNLDVLVERMYIERTQRYAVIVTHGPEHRFTHRDVWVDEAANVIETSDGIAKNQYAGGRTILGASPPTAQTHGLKGDVYRLKTPATGQVYEWVCTQSGCGKDAIWRPLARVE